MSKPRKTMYQIVEAIFKALEEADGYRGIGSISLDTNLTPETTERYLSLIELVQSQYSLVSTLADGKRIYKVE